MTHEQQRKAVHSAIEAGEIPAPEIVSWVMSWLGKKNNIPREELVKRGKAGALKRWGKKTENLSTNGK